MSATTLQHILRTVDDRGIDAAAVVREFVDLGLLYGHEGAGGDAQIQLARPCHAHVYTGSTALDRRQLFLLTAVRLVLEGCAGDCPSESVAVPAARGGTHATPCSEGACGSVLRELLLPGVARLLPPTTGHTGPPPHAAVRRLCIQHGLLCLRHRSGVGTETDTPGAWVPCTPAAVAAVTGVLLSWCGEAGLDGVLPCPHTDEPRAHAAPGAAVTPRALRWLLHG
jgi:hypothetical protein